jgi:hypothetical protein
LNILLTFGIFYDHLVHFELIWYIFSGFGIMYQEKSGNPAPIPPRDYFAIIHAQPHLKPYRPILWKSNQTVKVHRKPYLRRYLDFKIKERKKFAVLVVTVTSE